MPGPAQQQAAGAARPPWKRAAPRRSTRPRRRSTRRGHRTGETQYPPGAQGHPFGAPKGQHRGDGRSHTQPGQAVAAAPAWNVAPLPEPPLFAGRSTPGQAPWHLPVGATPSGLAADGVRLGDLEVRAASVVGAGHRCQEPAVARQDAYALGRTADGEYLVVAIANGVSQSGHADLAARVAVNAAVRELTELVEKAGPQAIDATELYLKVAGEMIGTGRARGIQDREVVRHPDHRRRPGPAGAGRDAPAVGFVDRRRLALDQPGRAAAPDYRAGQGRARPQRTARGLAVQPGPGAAVPVPAVPG